MPDRTDSLSTYLDHNGIDVLDIATAEVLAKLKTSIQFSQNGLKTLSPEVAATLYLADIVI